MPHIETAHYRAINLAVAVLLLISLLNASVFDPGLFPLLKKQILYGVGAVALLSFAFVRPPANLGPLPEIPLTFTQMRIVVGAYLVVLFFFAGNYYLDWGFFNGLEKKINAVVVFIGVLAFAMYGPQLQRQLEEHEAKQRQGFSNDA